MQRKSSIAQCDAAPDGAELHKICMWDWSSPVLCLFSSKLCVNLTLYQLWYVEWKAMQTYRSHIVVVLCGDHSSVLLGRHTCNPL